VTTCRDLITDALEELRVYAAGETPSDEDMSLGLGRLQRVSDIYLGESSPELTLDSDVPGPDEEAFMYELALRLCGPFSASLTPEQALLHRKARTRMLSSFDTPTDADVEDAFLFLYTRSFSGNFNTGAA
jgi:hypothetical protein